MNQATLCFLIRPRSRASSLRGRENQENREILLAFKKRGFGQGKWNGVGGKLDFEKDKNIFETAIREIKEEIGVKAKDIEKMAILNFYFPYQNEWNQDVHVFFAKEWQGEPKESEEMKPKWFKINEIPFNQMWPDDKFWLLKVLNGEKLRAEFVFKEREGIASYNIELVNKFD